MIYIVIGQNKDIASFFADSETIKIQSLAELDKYSAKNTRLLLEFPESGKHPSEIAQLKKDILAINSEVDLYITTHSYLLAHGLSLEAEYRDITNCRPIKFISILDNPIWLEYGDDLVSMNYNHILNEYAAFYDLEKEYYFKRKLKQQ